MSINLDEYQLKVVNEKCHTLVIAGPGSGKSTTIAQKVLKLLENNVSENEILLISFTNKSVEDLKKKLGNNIFITTFHRLAIDILKYNNIEYQICDENLLDYIIDEYLITIKDKDKLCRYLNIISLNKNKNEYISLKKLIKTFINLYKTNNHNINDLKNITTEYHDKYLIKIILDIFYIYEEEKNSTKSLDFDDLIIYATTLLKKNYNYKKFKYIIIDEFQDTSLIRFNLAKTIIDNTGAILTAVGDDAQSIYHFSGCDLFIFLNLNNYFSNIKTLKLVNTYRFSQELINITANFINKNPYQLDKSMHGSFNEKHPIEIIYYLKPIIKFKKLIENLYDKDILILGRNQKDIYEYIDKDFLLNKDELIYKDKKFKYLTIHSAKGLESDYVIILNVSNKTLGIPNKIENHQILSYVSSDVDNFPYAEERRVFFVALTRCKYKTFLMVPKDNPSIFIKEIKKML
ncbi:MAG: UvrD-helicase domain-containing protein [Bacilli bacterium]